MKIVLLKCYKKNKTMRCTKMLSIKPNFIVLIAFLICSFSTSFLYGQNVAQENEMRKSLDFMFEHLDRNSVPTGLLRDYDFMLTST